MKKRYQKAPRISKWNHEPVFIHHNIKRIEQITGKKMPDEFKKRLREL